MLKLKMLMKKKCLSQDNVRILLKRERFDKKTKHNWSEEIFKN